MTDNNERLEQHLKSARAHLIGKGYTDIEIVGHNVDGYWVFAQATLDGVRYSIRLVVPQNMTAIRHPHFRIAKKKPITEGVE